MDILYCKGYIKKRYPIYISEITEFSDLFSLLPEKPRKFVIIDAAVRSNFTHLAESLATSPDYIISIEASEENKSFESLEAVLQKLFTLKPDKSDVVTVVGGGVLLNLGGLAASLVTRGLRFYYVPTTLTAQIDVCMGSKQAVNFNGAKNWIGVFNDPEFCYINARFTDTQTEADIRSQSIEGIKLCLASNKKQFEASMADIENISTSTMHRSNFITNMIKAKIEVVAEDLLEKQHGVSMLYGHTVGHAIEMLAPQEVNHGIGVGIGMLVAARISRALGLANEDLVAVHLGVLQKLGLPTTIPATLKPEAILKQLHYDKKNFNGKTPFVLLKQVGEMAKNGEGYLIPVEEQQILKALKESY
jgi:3-dehydroquinate synthase